METLRLYPKKDAGAIRLCSDIIRRGGVVALPTETVYGLGANALDADAVKKIFTAKGRPQDNPLIVHIADTAAVDELCLDISDDARKIIARFWPGPLTVILKKRSVIPDVVSCGLDTVGIRFPAHPVAQELIRTAGVPIAAPSANTSGRPSPTSMAHVIDDMDGRVDAIIDGGECEIGLESTVVDLTKAAPVILRPGAVTLEALRELVPETRAADFNHEIKADEKVPSPGMKYRHYAPKARVTVLTGMEDAVFEYISERKSDEVIGIMCFDECYDRFSSLCEYVETYGNRCDAASQSAKVFAALRAFDDTPVGHIFVYATGDTEGLGMAVNNRLSKAAGFRIIRL